MTGALSHIRVLDLSRVLAGPWCAQILGDLGADVIKVENPKTGDDTRGWGPPFLSDEAGERADAAYYLCANRNKRAIAVDITTPEGQEVIIALARESDVVIENFKTGGLKKYGLDYDGLKAHKPDLIYCSITGFGQNGPLAHAPGYDYLIQAMGGLMSVTGEGAPVKVGVPVVDLFTGVYASNAIMAALIARDQGMGGQYIDMALFDVQLAMLANQASNYLVSGAVPQPLGNAHPNIVPYQNFPTADREIIVAVGNDRQFAAFAQVLGRDDWAKDPRFMSNAGRVENRTELTAMIALCLKAAESGVWLDKLSKAGIPCGPINSVKGAFGEAQAQARGAQVEIPVTGVGSVPVVTNPIHMSVTPPHYRLGPPRFAEHTTEVLQKTLNWDEKKIAKLRQSGAIV